MTEMAHDDAALAQGGGQTRSVFGGVPREHEIRSRRQHFKTQRLQARRHPRPGFDHGLASLLKVLCIFQCRHCAGRCQAINGVGVETVLYAVQPVDELGAAHGEAYAQPGQRTRLGEGLHDQQVVIARDQAHGRFTAEIHIGLVDYDDGVGVARDDALDLGQAECAARGGIGVRENDGAGLPAGTRQTG
ncbi:hypothetical protein G6F65_020848 [Rhizopus arrhizus]|nr:hypothetical protein G6F65_020848 [Rhizopus arrhizus]